MTWTETFPNWQGLIFAAIVPAQLYSKVSGPSSAGQPACSCELRSTGGIISRATIALASIDISIV